MRLPGKNIRILRGKPLVAHSIEAALASCITRVVVSTDSDEVARVSKEFGAEVPFMRPDYLATGNAVIEDAIFDLLGRLKDQENYVPDVIVLLQPTSPLRSTHHINEAIKLLVSKGAESVVSVSEPMEHPACMARWDDDGRIRFALGDDLVPGEAQHQDFPEYFFINGAIYCFTVSSLMRNKSRFSEKPFRYVMDRIDSVDVDTTDEFKIAEAILGLDHDPR
jgi:CMP-N,N'-diacetyllegionaminic acid synthase